MKAPQHTFLVVGSGGGGGTIAWVLAKAGYDVLVLEQGPDFAAKYRESKEDFNPTLHDERYFRLRKPDPKRRLRGDYNTFMERDKESVASPFAGGWTGSVVGGGSVLWGTWAFRALPIDYKLKTHFERTKELAALEKEGYAIADWPIAYSEMLPFYGVAEALMGVSGDREAVNNSIKGSDWYKAFKAEDYWGREAEWFPDPKRQAFPMSAYPITPVGHVVAEGFKHAGMQPFPLPVAIVKPGSAGLKTRDALRDALAAQYGGIPGGIWEKRADDLWSAQIRQACNMCGFCGEYLCWGRTGPKWGTQDTTLKELAGTKELTVRPNAKAIEILYDGGRKRATGIAYLDLSDPDHPRHCEASAEYVIVSCGAVQTPRLLFLSGPDRGLGNSSDQLGRNATFHMFGLGTKVTLDPRFQGLLHGEFGPTGNISTFAQYFMKHPSTGAWVKGGHLTSTAKKNPLEDAVTAVVRDGKLGKALLDGITEHNRKLEVRLTADDLPMPDNRVTLDPNYVDEYGVPVARIARKFGANERRVFEAGKPVLESVFKKYQGSKGIISSLATDDAILKLIGDHQMGTCRMGDDPKTSVVNRFCRLHDASNVFVVDSSFMPTGLGLNPMVTVVANALRVGTHIVDRLKRGEPPGGT
jgi:choline dehydrogenase-like flavoprotein